MAPIAKSFNVPLVEVTAVFTITPWMRLVGRHRLRLASRPCGRKIPLIL